MSDEIINELWRVKDDIAREHGYDIEALAAHLRARERPEDHQVVDLGAVRKAAEQGVHAGSHGTRR